MQEHSDMSRTTYAVDAEGHISFKTAILFQSGEDYTVLEISGVADPGKRLVRISKAHLTIELSVSQTQTNTE